MGNRISHGNAKQLKKLNKISIKSKESETLKKVWQLVENDVNYYGSAFGKIFFQNHPEYIKYFQYDLIPQFVQDAKMKKKFSSVCAIMSTLIVDYFNKPQQRNDVLDFIAMIHKDMQLTLKDLENFSSDFLEMLKWEFPVLMTKEQIVIQSNQFNILIHKMNSLMIIHRENDLKFNSNDDSIFRSLCGWNKNRTIYGKSLEYWEARRIYWCTRVALWSTLVTDFSNTTHSKIRKNVNDSRTKRRKERSEMRIQFRNFSETSSIDEETISSSTNDNGNTMETARERRRQLVGNKNQI
ncbi:uncharacterized protein LOC122509335 isoform X2 [Leptopilina heterotoma]|uniref:uncharacterized protein LOC122509335 isoform X2 n=1 Tax=Leptopilina heterotoma TaxID=63436 RepID=UPI001CA93DFE|nr:uncharacterized protein LOC122509335 isoform X2 [Leptopilina heterotoma]